VKRKKIRGNSYRVNSDISNSYGVSDMWQWLSSTPGDGEGKEMKKEIIDDLPGKDDN